MDANRAHLHACVGPSHEPARCGVFHVPERRNAPNSRSIALGVMILPARDTTSTADPIVFFDGGPGLPATHDAAYANWALQGLRATHDVLLVDMRGTSDESPLECDLYDDHGSIAPYLERMAVVARVRACVARLSKHADLTQYTTESAARDFDDVRAALHVDRVSLFGASYGSRLALTYMRLFPSHVARAVLLGVSPPEMPVGHVNARGTQDAIDSAFAACAADASCHATAPDPRADIVDLLSRLRREPAPLRLWNWRRLWMERVTLTAPEVAELLWMESYVPGALADDIRLVHTAMITGDLTPLTRRFVRVSRSRRSRRQFGLMLSVVCAEDAPRLTAADTEANGTLLGAPVVADLIAACHEWPRGSVSQEFFQRVVSSIPTLLISGGRDPVTPFYVADSAAKGLSHSERYVDPNAGHAALDDRSRARMAEFLGAR